ncbi:flavodoxin [Erysipelotrichaceae bacterium HCN-30851]
MKKFLKGVFSVCFILTLAACSSGNQVDNSTTDNTPNESQETTVSEPSGNTDTLIVYYSFSGNTKAAAEELQRLTGGDIAAITRTQDYPSDNDAFTEMAEQEILDKSTPEISLSVDSLDEYDVIFVGYPIWWEEAPAMIRTFLTEYDFQDKTVVPFCTSSSDGIEESLDVFDVLDGKATVTEGLRVNDYDEIPAWLEDIGINN